MLDRLKNGELTIEVKAINPERVLNALWNKGIYTGKVVKIDMVTLSFIIRYEDYEETIKIIKKIKGKYRVVNKNGMIALIIFFKSKISLLVGAMIFFIAIYSLSTYIWAIDIETKNNVAPFEVRKELKSIGIQPGLKKSSLNVYEIERKLENMNDEIMWVRTRIEGSTLKIVIEEKINPPSLQQVNPNAVVAKMDGEIQRVYTYAGNPAVKPGDIVKEGDTLISSTQSSKEGHEKEVQPSGTVIANTFYEKSMEVQISGEKLTRTGNKNSEVYLNLLGKKIYLKKCIEGYKYYDKIEENNGFINKTLYFEKNSKPINEDKDEAVKKASESLEESLKKTLSNDSKIVNKEINVEEIGDGKIQIKIFFTVEQDIAKNIS